MEAESCEAVFLVSRIEQNAEEAASRHVQLQLQSMVRKEMSLQLCQCQLDLVGIPTYQLTLSNAASVSIPSVSDMRCFKPLCQTSALQPWLRAA